MSVGSCRAMYLYRVTPESSRAAVGRSDRIGSGRAIHDGSSRAGGLIGSGYVCRNKSVEIEVGRIGSGVYSISMSDQVGRDQVGLCISGQVGRTGG